MPASVIPLQAARFGLILLAVVGPFQHEGLQLISINHKSNSTDYTEHYLSDVSRL